MYAKQNRAGEVRERAEIRAPVSAAAADGKKEKEANLAFLSHLTNLANLSSCLSLKQFESTSTCNYLE